MRKLIDKNYARSKKILTKKIDKLHLLAKALIEFETLDADEIDQVLAGKKFTRSSAKKKTRKPPEEPSATAPDTGKGANTGDKEAGQEV